MPKILKISIITLFIIILLLAVVPFLIPIENYKGMIISEVKKATNRDLKIDGKISLTFLPTPTVTLNDVSLSNIEGAQAPYFFKTQEAKVSINIIPLFTGKVKISSVMLNHPEINLEVLKDGQANWEFNKTTAEEVVAPENNNKNQEQKFSINKVLIKGGTAHYIKNGKDQILENIDLESNIKSLLGPMDFKTNFDALGKKINIKGDIKEIKDTIPLSADLNVENDTMHIEGNYSSSANTFTGKLSAKTNLKKYSENLPSGLFKDLNLEANISSNNEKVILEEVNFNSGTIKGFGNASYYLNNGRIELNFKLNPGEVNLLMTTTKIESDSLESLINVSSNSITTFTDALEIKNDQLKTLSNQKFSFSANTSYTNNNIIFKNLILSVGNGTLKGLLNYFNKDKKITYDLKVSNPVNFAKLASFDLPLNTTEAAFKGETLINKDSYKTDTDINIANTQLNVNGDINVDKVLKLALKIKAIGNNLTQSLSQLLNTNTNNLGRFLITLDLNGNTSESLKATLNPSTVVTQGEEIKLKGNSTINFNASKTQVNSSLSLSAVNLDNFTSNSSSPRRQNNASSHAGVANNSSTANSHWSSEKIDLKFLQSFEGDVDLNIQKIFKGSLVFDNVIAKMHVAEGILNLNSLTGNLFGGSLQGNGSISAQTSQPINFKVTLKNASLKNIVPNYKEFKITSGIFNLNLDLKTKGQSQIQYVQGLNGNIDFKGENGKLSGINLQKVINSFTEIKNWQSALNIIDSSFSGGETDFKTLKGTLVINNGIAQLKDFILLAEGAQANATGNIDLPKYYLDVWSTLTIDVKNNPTFKVHFYGPPDNPMHEVDTQALQKHLLQNVAKNVLDNIGGGKGKPADILQGIIGGGGNTKASPTTPAPTNAPSQQPVKAKPEDLLKKGLENLFN